MIEEEPEEEENGPTNDGSNQVADVVVVSGIDEVDVASEADDDGTVLPPAVDDGIGSSAADDGTGSSASVGGGDFESPDRTVSIKSAVDLVVPHIPGKLVNLIGKKNNLMKVQVDLNGHVLVGVIDSGAASSLISSDLVKKLGFDVNSNCESFSVIGTNEKMITSGSISSEVTIHGVKMKPTNFAVFPPVPEVNVNLLLGIDFLKANKIELCISKRLVIKHLDEGGSVGC